MPLQKVPLLLGFYVQRTKYVICILKNHHAHADDSAPEIVGPALLLS